MSEPLAYLFTWTTYGTWLRGDERGWVDKRRAAPKTPMEPPDLARMEHNRVRMAETAVLLEPMGRQAVEASVRDTCRLRGWELHEVSARSNHVHVVVTAPVSPDQAIVSLKAHGTRTLKQLYPGATRTRWWTEGGSKRYLNTPESLRAAIEYVRHQDVPH